MPTFELHTEDGKKFQVDAPDQDTAAKSLSEHSGSSSIYDSVGSALIGFVKGIPIAGPTILEGVERMAAAGRSAIHGTKYDDELTKVRGIEKQTTEDHPIAETVGEVGSGITTMAAGGATAPGARLLGLTGNTLKGMAGRSAASGAVINAADAAARGENPLSAAFVGGVAGVAAPVAGAAISKAAEPISNAYRAIRNPADEAARRVSTALDRDISSGMNGLSPQEFAAARSAGTPVNLMDAGGETTRALARSAANTSPEGRGVLNKAIDDRFETQNNRLTDWLQSTFHYPNVQAQQEALDQVSKTVNKGAYVKAYRDGSSGLWSPELERLAGSDAVANAMKTAAKNAKDEAIVSGYGAMNPNITFSADGRIQFTKGPKGVPTYPDLQFWDLTRRELSDAAMKAGPGTTEARRYTTFAKTLNAELDKLVPSYANARQGAARFFGAEDAMDAGQQAVSSKMNNRDMRAALSKMSPQEKQLFQDGFVDRFVQQIREVGDRRSVLNQVASSPAARERLSIAMGTQRSKELESMLRVEGVMDLARSSVQGNSTTARQLTELGLAGGVYGYESYSGDPQAIMKAALTYGAARGHRVIDERVAQQVAKLLTSNDITQLNKGIKLIASNQTMLQSVRRADAALAAVVGRGASGPVAGRLGLEGTPVAPDANQVPAPPK